MTVILKFEDGTRKIVSDKKARRQRRKGSNVKEWKYMKAKEHVQWMLRKGIVPRRGTHKEIYEEMEAQNAST